MSNLWKIKKGDVDGGPSGQLLEGVEVRAKTDGKGYELVAILAETNDSNLPVNFPTFAYRGLVWNIELQNFDGGQLGDQPQGPWANNARNGRPGITGDETGTWTAQAGSGVPEDGKEDAASAYA